MTSKTITDRAGDTLRLSTGSLTAGPGEITIKVTERFRGREAVAAVHVDPAALRAALDGVAPLGKYTRTAPDPDDMDGGVAAALIEKEAEEPTSEVRELREALAREVARGNALQDALDAAPHAMTAREHLDAAWEAAHVPADGMIHAGAEYVARKREREVRGPFTTGATIPDTDPSGVLRRRLLDPPAPARPEWADAPAVLAVCNDTMDRRVFVRDGADWWKADQYASATSGLRQVTPLYPKETVGDAAVRAPEDGDPR